MYCKVEGGWGNRKCEVWTLQKSVKRVVVVQNFPNFPIMTLRKDYMFFVVKLTIGVMTGGKHVQYCVNKIDKRKPSHVIRYLS